MANTINLGFKAPDYGMPEAPTRQPEGKTEYPELVIPGNKELCKSLKVGQEFTATVKFRVCEITMRERDGDQDEDDSPWSGNRVELKAESMVMEGVKMNHDDDEDGSEALSRFLKKKK